MIAIICVDDTGGMRFNRRRQSRDRGVTEDILRICDGGVLRIHPFSEKLFIPALGSAENVSDVQIVCEEQFLEVAGEGEYCFVENADLKPYLSKLEKLILYKWNRTYPADQYFDVDLERWEKAESVNIRGNSHDRITRDIYVRGE